MFNLQIQEIAKEAGVITVNEFRTLLAFYHDLGILIHYGGPHVLDNALQRTVILKPQWLIDMFKRIITVKEGDQQVGMIPRKKWQILLECGTWYHHPRRRQCVKFSKSQRDIIDAVTI